MCRLIIWHVLRWAKLSRSARRWRWGRSPDQPGGLSFSRPASLMTPFPGRHSADRQQQSLWSGAALLSHSCQTPGPPCPERASNLSDICSRSYLVIRDRPLSRPATDTSRSQLSLGPGSISGDLGQGRVPVLGAPREKKLHHHYLWGVDQGGGGGGGRLQGATGLLLFPKREGDEGKEEDGQTGLTGNWANDWGGCILHGREKTNKSCLTQSAPNVTLLTENTNFRHVEETDLSKMPIKVGKTFIK